MLIERHLEGDVPVRSMVEVLAIDEAPLKSRRRDTAACGVSAGQGWQRASLGELIAEDDVKCALMVYLEAQGDEVVAIWGRARGIDIDTPGDPVTTAAPLRMRRGSARVKRFRSRYRVWLALGISQAVGIAAIVTAPLLLVGRAWLRNRY